MIDFLVQGLAIGIIVAGWFIARPTPRKKRPPPDFS